MSVVRTAISLQASLFEEMVEIAADVSLSRSKLMAVALQEYIERYKNKRLFEQLNAAYEDDEQEEELSISDAYLRSVKTTEDNVW